MKKISKIFSALLSVGLIAGCSLRTFTSDFYSDAIADPLMKYAWHISNVGQAVFAPTPGVAGYDLNLLSTWNNRIYGNGILIQVSDDGIEDTHEDLSANFSYLNISKNYTLPSPYTATTARPIATTDDHGTAVAGLIAAVGWNKVGTRGVAPRAHLSIANFVSDGVTQSTAKLLDQASGDYDISNMSWGSTQNNIGVLDTSYNAQLRTMVTTKRSGKGTLFIKAAGNDFAVLCNGSTTAYCVGNANFDPHNVIPYLISVAAMNAKGDSSTYSSPGPAIWISAPGGEFGDDSPAMLTTDLSGCTLGRSKSSATKAFEKGAVAENANCNYSSVFNGTSSAAPTVSGVVALLLEANPALTWRDIKYILAKTATVDNFATGTIPHPQSLSLPTGYTWEQKWITNAAQFKYHNWRGFGRVNTAAAITLANRLITFPTALGTFTETNWVNSNTGLTSAIPDNSATGVTDTLTVVTALTIEAVQIKVDITHADISELALELTSPGGTKSILVNARNSLKGITNYTGETFISNAFYQEPSAGVWTLRVIDAKAGITGTLTSFKLNFFGGAH
ncbi:MAG: S8 family serine peptidase [Bdellovibrionaceae bacterium]|nr:S8 family serine peptidase [Bdellovibrio sp.]